MTPEQRDNLEAALMRVPDDMLFAEYARRESELTRAERFRRILDETPIVALVAALKQRDPQYKRQTGKTGCHCGLSVSAWSTKPCCKETYRAYRRNKYRERKGIPLDAPAYTRKTNKNEHT